MGLIVYENLSDALAKKIQEGIDITDIATDSKLGIVKVDNTSITIDADGTLHAVGGSGSGGLTSADIADNLTTDDSTKVLSAKQGKILNDKVVDVEGDVATIINSIIEIENGTSLTGVVKTVNNIAPDGNGNVEITVSGDGLTTADILDVLDSTATDKALSANQGKALDDKITTHAETKASTTVLGHVTVDGTTIQSVDGKLSIVPSAIPTTPSTGRFTSTTKTDVTHTYLYTPSISLLDSDDIDIIFNTTMLDNTDWELVDDGGNKAIKINTNYYATDTPENYHVSGRIYRGFTAL